MPGSPSNVAFTASGLAVKDKASSPSDRLSNRNRSTPVTTLVAKSGVRLTS